MLNIYVVPGGERNLRYIWCEFPGMEVSDVLMNQFGVSIASNGCPSREDKGEFTGEGVLYEVRMAVAKYARTAREAVSVIGSMVETFGYKGSGRSYIVADPSEGWVVSVVKGKHWVAQRVPDDKVMTIPNYYVIQDIDLDDEVNFAGSEDIVEYAISRGWYDPEKDAFKVMDTSSNGTFIGGQKLPKDQKVQVPDNTIISLGGGENQFILRKK